MVVTFIIPIRSHLAKYLRPRSWKNTFRIGEDVIPRAFSEYNEYIIKMRVDKAGENIRDYYFDYRLFRVYRPGKNLPEYLKKYKTPKFTFLKFNFPVQKRKQLICKHSIDRDILCINGALHHSFWNHALLNVLYYRNGTLKQAVDRFYYEYKLTNEDYPKKSFISMLYKKKNQVSVR